MQHSLPRAIYINENFWKVRYAEVIKKQPMCQGLCIPHRREILIKLSLSPRERVITFMHELLHAIDYEYDLKIPHALVYGLEEPLANFFIENGWITWANWELEDDGEEE